ncbi:hypothetical protein H5410_020702 [Solanum commersonii]|uniref:Uncharacterized protein n=1 Tax=Solanum commersonii TaxID=4109 RepID=A0A9J5ZAQ2_SOLCO|nr:hypothetical protein H5410_020702 [Solanum commersonii]
MKEIGDQCGGWIEVEEETQLKNHLRWSHIRVKGPLKEILAYVEVSDGEFNFSLPVWCEAPVRFRRNSDLMHVEQLEGTTQHVSGRELPQQNSLLTFIPKEVEHNILGTILEVLDQIEIKGSESHEAQLPKKDLIQLEKEPFVDNLFSIENNFFSSSNISEMEMGTGVRTETSFAKDDVAIYFGSKVLGGVAFKGCDKVTFDLFLRIDQKKGDLRQKKVETTPIKARNTIPKEIRNMEFHVDIYVLVETKLGGSEVNVFKQLWQNRWIGEFHLDAIGRSGGIVVMWDKRVWRGELVIAVNQIVTCKFEGINQALIWFVSTVYASSCGDFNATRYLNERSEGHKITTPMTEFFEWINEMEFIDETFTRIKHNMLPRIGSDHNPILLECGDLNLKKSYFKFEQLWLRVKGFSDKLVKDWWASFDITEKRGNLKSAVNFRKDSGVEITTEDELLQKVHLSMEFKDVAKNEEIAWRQRSRVHWLKHGDKTIKYFHRMATTYKRFNTIDELMVEGVIVTDSEEIKGTIISYYQNLYRETEQWRPEFNVHGAKSITQEENVWLQRKFEEDEVFNCIKSCASDKALGPDGFLMSFFQNF